MKPKEKDYVFQSGLATQITAFLDEKHRLGFKYEREYHEFKNLDRFSMNYDCTDRLPEELVLAWTERKPHHSPQTTIFKINVIRELAKFMSRNGCETYLYPECMAPKKTHEHTPYIFTHEEIGRFFSVIDQMQLSPNSSKRHLIFPLLFRLLYCCGLRVSEALRLKVADVNIQNGVLHIRDAKDYRDRLIPMEESLREHCIRYMEQAIPDADPDQYFFPAPDGFQYHIFTVRNTFREMHWKCGIPYGGRLVGPRLHDLRHTFAVHCLQKLIASGREPLEILPLLATYLGHKSYHGTSRYLHLTTELFPEIIAQMEAAFKGLLPGSEDLA